MTTERPTIHAKTFSFRPLHSEDISEEDLQRAGSFAWKQFEEELLRQVVANMGIPASIFTAANPHTGKPEPVDFETMKRAEPVPANSTPLLQ